MVFAARSEHHMEAFISLICGLIAAVSFCQEDKSDSLLVIADGVIHGKLIENKQQPPLYAKCSFRPEIWDVRRKISPKRSFRPIFWDVGNSMWLNPNIG